MTKPTIPLPYQIGRSTPPTGDLMLLGVGCVSTGVVVPSAFIITLALGLEIGTSWRGLLAGEVTAMAALLGVGGLIGWRYHRWGFLQGVATATVALALLLATAYAALRVL